MMTVKKRNYTDEFKRQIVTLRKSGKSAAEIAKEYQLAKSTVNKWISDFSTSGSFKTTDNRIEEENKQLLMENDILKQAALIMAQK